MCIRAIRKPAQPSHAEELHPVKVVKNVGVRGEPQGGHLDGLRMASVPARLAHAVLRRAESVRHPLLPVVAAALPKGDRRRGGVLEDCPLNTSDAADELKRLQTRGVLVSNIKMRNNKIG